MKSFQNLKVQRCAKMLSSMSEPITPTIQCWGRFWFIRWGVHSFQSLSFFHVALGFFVFPNICN